MTDLVTTDAKVVEIAFAAGFGSVSHFYAVFTRLCGQSPKHFRDRQSAGTPTGSTD